MFGLGGLIMSLVILTQGAARSDTTAPPAAIVQQFGVLTAQSGVGDALPSEAGITADVSRRINTGTSSLNQWIVTKGDQLCQVVNGAAVGEPELSTAGFACGPPSQNYDAELLVMGSARHSAGLGVRAAGPEILVGLAPDGTEAVIVTYTNGSTETVPATDNGWHAAAAGRRPATLSWVANGVDHLEDMTKA